MNEVILVNNFPCSVVSLVSEQGAHSNDVLGNRSLFVIFCST